MELIFFYIFAALSVASAIGVIAFRNPLSSAVSLIVTLFGLACLFVLSGAPFIAAIQILIYAGAIMVLFVFVIMMLNLGREELKKVKITFSQAVGILLGGSLGILLALRLGYFSSPLSPVSGEGAGGVKEVGRLIFSDYLIPFEITSVLLLVAIVGAVVLAREGA